MATVTLKNVPEELLDRLRARSARDRRSLNQQILFLLERALDRTELAREAESQSRVWSRLAGRWQSDLSAQEEIDRLYSSRSAGRDVEL